MELLNPLALGLVPLVAILLWLNSRRPRDRQSVANLYLWQQAATQAPARLRFRRVWKHWLLALQIAFMLAVVVALARPALTWHGARAAFVFDLSASMAAKADGRTRLDVAKDRALRQLADLAGARVRIVAARSTAIDRGEFRASDARAKAAIRDLASTNGASAIADGIQLARVADGDEDIYVFSDRGQPDAPLDARVHWIQIGAAGENVAITTLTARHSPARTGIEVLAGVRNFGTIARDVPLEITQSGAVVAAERVHLDAGAARTVLTTIPEPREEIGDQPIAARIAVDDDLALDNQRLTIVRSAAPLRVLLRTDGNVFLEQALASNPRVALQTIGRTAPAAATEYDVVVCDECAALPSETGGVLWLHASTQRPGTSTQHAAPNTQHPTSLVVADTGHPIARSLDLDEASAAVAADASVPAGADVIVRAAGQPAVVAYEDAGRRVVDVRIALRDSTLPLSVGFPILIANATEWVAERNRNPVEIVAGEPLQWHLSSPTRSSEITVVDPTGETIPSTVQPSASARGADTRATARPRRSVEREGGPAANNKPAAPSPQSPASNPHPPVPSQGTLIVPQTDRLGAYEVRGLGPRQPVARFVVNPPAGESDLSGRPFDAPGSTTTASTAVATRGPNEVAVWLIVVALGLLAVEGWAFRRQAPASRAFAARALTAVLLALAALGVGVPIGGGPIDVLFVLDRSDSIAPRSETAALARVRQMSGAMRSGDRAGLAVFGLDAALERTLTPRFQASEVSSALNTSGTNIERALALGRAALPNPSHSRIVLVSDGRETIGSAADEAARAAAAHLHVDTVPIDRATAIRSQVTHLTAPADVQVREPFAIRVDVEGRAGARDRVVLSRDAEPIATTDIVVSAAGASSATFTDSRPLDGSYTYTAAIENSDDDVRAVGGVVAVSGAPAILYVGAADSVTRPLAAAGFTVTRGDGRGVPSDFNLLRRYAAVVLDHVAADALAPAQTAALTQYVEQTGGGLLVLGDARTLDAGGYAAGPLGRLLPVDFRPRAGVRDPTMGLVLVFDKSGSMADRAEGIPKIEIAREAAKKAFDVVPPRDSIGVVAFDASPTVAVPFGPAGNARDIVERLRAIQPGGSTAIAPAVGMAVDWLRGANVTKRYILLVSDGRTSPADADRLRAAIQGTGVELSVVAIGADADRPFLQDLAASSGGRAYFPDDARVLPTIVAREATRAAGGSVVDEPFTVRVGAHPVAAGLDRSAPPTIGGYVVGAVRPGATAILASHLDDPILAGWQVGLGRVAVFTSDLASPWTSAFQRWSSFGALWAQTARWLGRRTSDALLAADVVESAGSATLVVNAERPDGRAINLLDPHVNLRTAAGEDRAIELTARRPGRYEAAIPATATGTYTMAVTARDDTGADARVVRAFYWSADRERRAIGVDRAALERIAAVTGGRVLGPNDNPFDGERPRDLYPLRSPLLLLSLLVFLVDIATRRGVRLSARHTAAA